MKLILFGNPRISPRKPAQKSSSGYSACCPAHEDENPSLSIKEGCDGKILLHCFAGCPISSICGSLGLEMSDLFDSDLIIKPCPKRTVYAYKDEQGQELYRKIRIEPGLNGKDKSFYFERVDENRQIVQNLQGCRKVLYRLQRYFRASQVEPRSFWSKGRKMPTSLLNMVLSQQPHLNLSSGQMSSLRL